LELRSSERMMTRRRAARDCTSPEVSLILSACLAINGSLLLEHVSSDISSDDIKIRRLAMVKKVLP
jgi:hypothetical protein